jgi:hypothetical protein
MMLPHFTADPDEQNSLLKNISRELFRQASPYSSIRLAPPRVLR